MLLTAGLAFIAAFVERNEERRYRAQRSGAA